MKKLYSKKFLLLLFLISNGAMASVYIFQAPKETKGSIKAVKSSRSNSTKTAAKGLLAQALRAHQTELEACYEEYLRTEPPIPEGAVTVKWRLNPDGKVQTTQIDGNELQDPDLESCIYDQAKSFEFPHPGDRKEWILSHRFQFKRKTAARMDFGMTQ